MISRPRLILLPALLALAGGCRSGPALSPTARPTIAREDLRPSAVRARERGVAFLVGTQNPDGSWGSFESARPDEDIFEEWASCDAFQDATSALGVMALQGPSRRDPAAFAVLERGVDYLCRAPTTKRVSGEYLYDNWAHLYITHALSLVVRDPRFESRRGAIEGKLRREIEALEVRQGADGGWGYYDFDYGFERPAGDDSTCFMTAGVLLALDEAKRSGIPFPPHLVPHGLRTVERLRLGGGSYVYGNYASLRPGSGFNQVKGSLGRSQPCNLALWRYGRGVKKEDLRKGIENLFRHHHFIEIGRGRPIPHEAWYSTAAYYYLFGHFYAAKVLEELDPADREKWCPILAGIIVRDQNEDGSWIDYPMYRFDRPYGTAFALMILESCLESPPVVAAAASAPATSTPPPRGRVSDCVPISPRSARRFRDPAAR